MHGFDEFFGNLYHLNAEEEPEYADYPKDPNFKKKFGPRGVMKCKADRQGRHDCRSGVRQGRQADDREHRPAHDEADGNRGRGVLGVCSGFHGAENKRGRALGSATSIRHACMCGLHLKPSSVGVTGHGLYPDGMVELDGYVGQLLKKLDDLGVADDTIVVFTTDNGAEVLSWPDGGATPFRGEKDTNWEGGWRVPCVMRWPGVDRARPGHQRHLFAAGLHPDLRGGGRRARSRREGEERLQGRRHDLQGSPRRLQPSALPVRQGQGIATPRLPLLERRRRPRWRCVVNQYKIVFAEQRQTGLEVWREPLVTLRIPRMYDLRSDPFERGDESFKYNDWFVEHVPYQYAAQAVVHEWLETLQGIPAAPEAGELQRRPDHREADAEEE